MIFLGLGFGIQDDHSGKMKRLFVLLALLLLPVLPLSVSAQTRVPSSQGEIQLSFAPLVAKAAPAVVNIYTRRIVVKRFASPFANDPLFQRFFGRQFGGRERERESQSLGSGVIVRNNGLVITNHHVVENAAEITVVLADRREFPARLLRSDEDSDLAILRIEANERFPTVDFRPSDELAVGDLVLAIGNPFGVGQTVTSGIVSALARSASGVSDFDFFIQTDAAINPGNSGGALIDMSGRLVGINTAIYSRDGGSLGIGFAVPSEMVQVLLRAVERDTPVSRPWVGITTQPLDAELASALGLARPAGVLVTDVNRRGPGAQAGLRQRDVIVAVNGRPTDTLAALDYRLVTLDFGNSASVEVIRDGRRLTLPLVIVPPPEDPPRNLTDIGGRNPMNGATVANLSPALAAELRMAATSGVVITTITRGSTAARFFRPGDRVTRLNRAEIGSVSALTDRLGDIRGNWDFVIERDGRQLRIPIRS